MHNECLRVHICASIYIRICRTEEINQKNKIPIVATRQHKDVGNNKTRAETYGNVPRLADAAWPVRATTQSVGVGGVLVEYNIVILLLCLSANRPHQSVWA